MGGEVERKSEREEEYGIRGREEEWEGGVWEER